MMSRSDQAGFSAVELLITLIIASLFVIMGFQLYSVSIENSGDARREAAASALAYKKLRQLSTNPTEPLTCPSEVEIDVDNAKARQTTSISCPYAAPPFPTSYVNIRLVKVKVRYNVSGTEVSHAMYITKN